MNNFKVSSLASICAFGLSACASIELPPTYAVYGVMKTASFSDDGSVKTAKRGDMLLTQKVYATKTAEVTQPVSFVAGRMLGKVKLDIPKGYKLYAMKVPQKAGKYYCSYDANVKAGGALHIGGIDPLNRACFADTNSDGKFEGLFVLPTRQTSQFGGGTMGEPSALSTQISYTEIAGNRGTAGEIGLWYADNGRMFTVSVNDGKPEVINEGEVKVSKIKEFPKIVEMSDMSIEILSVNKKNVMEYRIINALPAGYEITQRTTVSTTYY